MLVCASNCMNVGVFKYIHGACLSLHIDASMFVSMCSYMYFCEYAFYIVIYYVHVGASALVNVCLCIHVSECMLVCFGAYWCLHTCGCVHLYACVLRCTFLGA